MEDQNQLFGIRAESVNLSIRSRLLGPHVSALESAVSDEGDTGRQEEKVSICSHKQMAELGGGRKLLCMPYLLQISGTGS